MKLKLKELLKKEDIELGKVYTHKDRPPFKINEENESLWTWIYKGMVGGFRKAGKKGGQHLEDVAQASAFLVKTEFGKHAKNDFIKAFKKWM